MVKKLLLITVLIAIVAFGRLFVPIREGPAVKTPNVKFELNLENLPIKATLKGDEFGDDDVTRIAAIPSLRSVELAESRVTRRGLESLSALSQLEILDLSLTSLASEDIELVADISSLKELRLAGCSWLKDEQLASLVLLKNLDRLDLSETRITPAGLKHLTQIASLRELKLDRCPAIDEDAFDTLCDITQLQHLSVNGCEITSRGFQKLRHLLPSMNVSMSPQSMSDLRSLGQCGQFTVGGDGAITGFRVPRDFEGSRMALAADSLAVLKTLPALNSLDFSDSNVTDEMLLDLGPLPELQSLDLSNTTITDRGLQCLAGFPQLRGLVLFWTEVEGHGLQHLQVTTKLQGLTLQTRQGDEMLEHLFHLRELKKLWILAPLTDSGLARLPEFPELNTLGLYKTLITGPGLRHLADLPSLSRLTIIEGLADDAAIDPLSEFPALKVVEFRKTRVTPAGVARLQVLRPELVVSVSESGLPVPKPRLQ